MPVPEAEVRRLALAFPGAVEGSHGNHPDFRRDNRIFASLPRPNEMVIKLTPEQQMVLCDGEPAVFMAVPNIWGQRGWTAARLPEASADAVQHALHLAWSNLAPQPKTRKV